MELRKKVKRPQRYEPELDPRLDPAYTPRSTRPAFPIAFADFNPNLPPAAFPTLDNTKVGVEAKHHQVKRNKSRTSSSDHVIARDRKSLPNQLKKRSDPSNDAHHHSEAGDKGQDGEHDSDMQVLQTEGIYSKEEWFAKEMQTSDEEEELDDRRSEVSPHVVERGQG